MKTITKNKIISTLVKRFLTIMILGIGFTANAQSLCQAAFTYTVGNNGQVSFTNTSTGTTGSTIYQWQFGDNTGANVASPNHTYTYNGTYYATLMIDSSNGGCSSYITDSIIISNGISCNVAAAFTYTVGSNGYVSFTDASTGLNAGMIYSWTWYGPSGNGYGTSTLQSPSNTFVYNGTYTVTMNVGDQTNTCYSSATNTVAITNAQPCQVSFTYTVGSNGQVSFTNTSQGSTGYTWSFGDGNYSTVFSPSYTYAYNGVYHVYVSADTASGSCGGQADTTITISNTQNAPSCTAAFTYTVGNNGQVSFTNTSTGNVTNPSYTWSFGDGNNSTLSSPSYTYTYDGMYNVSISELDTFSNVICSFNQVVTITNALPDTNCQDSAYFNMVRDTAQTGVWNVYLNTNNTNYPINAVWNWGDGSTSNGLYPSHTYATPGWYSICVTAYFACGDSSYYCQNDSVYRANQVITVHVINNTQTGIKNNPNQINAVNIYPNPFADNLTINFNAVSGSAITYSIFDVYGKQIAQEKVLVEKGENNINLNTSSFNNGMYFVNITDNTNKKTQSLKIVK